MSSRTARERQYRAAERELIHVFSTGLRKKSAGSYAADCPSRWELRQFAAGKSDFGRRDELLAHLATCDRCIESMSGLRQRRWITRTAFALASATAVIAAAIWFWGNQPRTVPNVNRVATVDLRLISPTRGRVPGPQTVTVRKVTSGLRLVLPVGSEGEYEMEIRGQGAKPTALLRSSGRTRLEAGDIVLNLTVNLSNLKNEEYLLALRRDRSEWEYYSFHLE